MPIEAIVYILVVAAIVPKTPAVKIAKIAMVTNSSIKVKQR